MGSTRDYRHKTAETDIPLNTDATMFLIES
jgi:hypothetical protein